MVVHHPAQPRPTGRQRLPNAISISRGLAAIGVMLLVLHHHWLAALILLFVAELTDVLDGYLAEHWHCQTRLGDRLDKTADAAIASLPGYGLIIAHQAP